MADTYLPADVRKRIIDVMRERKLTQRELALRIDVNESTISRFLSGKTEKLSEESVIRIARVFNVSTGFYLGYYRNPGQKELRYFRTRVICLKLQRTFIPEKSTMMLSTVY